MKGKKGKGSFTNYVSMFFVFFDPLPPSLAIVSIWLNPPKNYIKDAMIARTGFLC